MTFIVIREISLKNAAPSETLQIFSARRPDIVHTHGQGCNRWTTAGFLYRWLTPGTLGGKPRSVPVVHTIRSLFHSYYGRVEHNVSLDRETSGAARYGHYRVSTHRAWKWRNVSSWATGTNQSDPIGSGPRRFCKSRVSPRAISSGVLHT